MHYFLIIVSVLLSSTSQLLMKKAATSLHFVEADWTTRFVTLITNIPLVAGIVLQILALGLWLVALRKVDISFAYPFISIGLIWVAIGGMIFFGETVSYVRWAGVFTICVGSILISASV